jgi:integrase
MLRIILSSLSDIIDLASLLAINISEDKSMNDFKVLSEATLERIRSFGIKSRSVIESFRRSCKLLYAFLLENDLEFSAESSIQWLSEFESLKGGTHYQHNLYLSNRRTFLLLLDFQNGQLNEWKTYTSKTAQRPTTQDYSNLLSFYKQHLIQESMSESTITFAIRVGSMFFCYLESMKIYKTSNLTAINVSDFFRRDVFSTRKPMGVQAYAYKLKKLLIFLEDMGIVSNENLHHVIPKVFAKQVSIVTTISHKAEQKLISNDKLSDPLGKRNQAMILLALRLGVRRSDIVGLKFSNINWQNDTITFIQRKTKVPITLPLLTDVGNALMDYILESRVDSDANEIFIRGYAPYKAMKPGSTSKISLKYLSEFNKEDCPEKGFHILRRTAATKLFENNVPSSVISASLGHLNLASADVYLSTDSKRMIKCALSLCGIECTKGELL